MLDNDSTSVDRRKKLLTGLNSESVIPDMAQHHVTHSPSGGNQSSTKRLLVCGFFVPRFIRSIFAIRIATIKLQYEETERIVRENEFSTQHAKESVELH